MPLIRYLTRIHFADYVLEDALEVELARLGITRPLVLLDAATAAAEVRVRLERGLRAVDGAVFHELEDPLPTARACAAAAERYLGRDCDGLVGFGAPQAIDLAKATGLRVSHGEDLARYATAEGGASRIREDVPPLIAVPTTAGTGTEVDGRVKLRLEDGRRQCFASRALLPRVAILDPSLMRGRPPEAGASQGACVLLRCFETYLASPFNPPAEGLALDGLRRAWRAIDPFVETDDLDARREMMAAALEGGLASQKGVGIGHALVDALAGLATGDGDPGRIAAVLLPSVLEFNRPAVGRRWQELESAIGDAAEPLPRCVRYRLCRLGLPRRLGQLGISREMIARAAEQAESDCAHRTNPRRARVEELRELMLELL